MSGFPTLALDIALERGPRQSLGVYLHSPQGLQLASSFSRGEISSETGHGLSAHVTNNGSRTPDATSTPWRVSF